VVLGYFSPGLGSPGGVWGRKRGARGGPGEVFGAGGEKVEKSEKTRKNGKFMKKHENRRVAGRAGKARKRGVRKSRKVAFFSENPKKHPFFGVFRPFFPCFWGVLAVLPGQFFWKKWKIGAQAPLKKKKFLETRKSPIPSL
jgi:hypothetical protein